MSWREKLLLNFGSGYFSGISLGDWLTLLRESRFAISPSCLIRAVTVTVFSIPNSFPVWLESARFRQAWEQVDILPPLFVLGHYRCGTTHLHNLLATDERFAYLNAYQASYPNSFLLTERLGAKLFGPFVPRSRPFDNVRLGFDVPYEDEIAMTNATRLTPYMTMVFPQRKSHYDRFLTFQAATDDEITRWRAGLLTLLKKLTLKYGKPLILKSPPHTCRIRLLLEMFPDAKFVHIHRNPYDVIQSTIHTIRVALDWVRFQDSETVNWAEHALSQWREMYDAYFAEKTLIPAGRLHEIAFADLERDPLGELRRTYQSLALPAFSEAEPRAAKYIASIARYERNKFPPLSVDLKTRVAEYCARGFDEWGYER